MGAVPYRAALGKAYAGDKSISFEELLGQCGDVEAFYIIVS